MGSTALRLEGSTVGELPLELRVLGSLEVTRGGTSVPVGGARQRSLLALLVVHRGYVVPVDRLVDELWGASPPATARHMVEVYVSRLRKALGEGIVVTRRPGYAIEVAAEQVDSARFEHLLRAGRELLAADQPETALARLDEGLALWRGPALAEFAYEPFAKPEIARLEELLLLAEEERIEAQLALGEDAGLVGELEELVAQAPLRERRHAQLMLALYRAGRQADALAAYRRARETLVGELGVEPGAGLRELERAILTHAEWLTVVRPEGGTASPARGARRSLRSLTARAMAAVAVLGVLLVAGAASQGSDADRRGGTARPDSVVLIDSGERRVAATVPVGDDPSGVAAAGRALWVTSDAGYVTRIDARNGASDRIDVGHAPAAIAIDRDAVWVANTRDATVSRIDRQTSAVTTVDVGNGPLAVAVGEGSVWVTSSADRTLTRIDPESGRIVATVATDAVGRGLAVGGGWVWLSDESRDEVVRVDPRTNTVAERIRVGSGPTGIAYGERAVWVANANEGSVWRIDPRTGVVTAKLRVGDGPAALAVGRGSVWVGVEFDRRVVRIDPRGAAPRVAGEVALADRPAGLAVTDDGVWVAVRAAGRGHRGGRLIAVAQPFTTIDPVLSAGSAFHFGLSLVYDGLTGFRRTGGAEGTRLVPNLATAIPAPREGGTSYTFRLRRGVRYSDGRLVRPADFRRALERAWGLLGEPFSVADLAAVAGSHACARAPRRCDLSRGVVASGDTVTFRLARRNPYFLRSLAWLFPVPPGTPAHDAGTMPVPGTGPYAIESFVPGRQVRLERNRHFRVWSAAARPDGYADEIVFRLEADLERSVSDIVAGRADVFLHPLPADRLEHVSGRQAGQLHVEPQPGAMLLFLDTTQPPFTDLRVRQALNFAIDRRRLVDLGGGPALRQPTCQLIPPAVPGYRPYCPYTLAPGRDGVWRAPDLAKARRLVAASGTRGQPVTVWTWPQMAAEGRYVVSLLRRLGYRPRLRQLPDRDAYFGAIFGPETRAQSGIVGFLNIQDGWDVLSTFSCGGPSNLARFCDAVFEREARRALSLLVGDPGAAAEVWAKLDRRLVDHAPVVPLFVGRWPWLASKRVGNWQYHPNRMVLLDQLWVR